MLASVRVVTQDPGHSDKCLVCSVSDPIIWWEIGNYISTRVVQDMAGGDHGVSVSRPVPDMISVSVSTADAGFSSSALSNSNL